MSQNKDLRIEKANELKAKADRAKAVVLTDYTGLSVSQINDLRSKIKAAGGDYIVTKNTLLRVALGLSKEDTSGIVDKLTGPTAVLFAIDDETSPIKALATYAKAANLPTVKGGLLGDKLLTPNEVEKLASLPTKEVLIGKLLGLLNAPITNLVYVLNGNQRKLVYALSQIAKSKTN